MMKTAIMRGRLPNSNLKSLSLNKISSKMKAPKKAKRLNKMTKRRRRLFCQSPHLLKEE